MTLDKAIELVYSFWNEISTLTDYDVHDREFRDPKYTKRLLEKADVKIDNSKNVIVVGSKGKGTTSSLLAEVLKSQGYKVGLFTSPHLERFTERIKINGKEISEQNLAKYIEDLRSPINQIARDIPKPYYLGPNGIFLAAALKYFGDNKTDINILESGRGGRYDDVFGLGNHVIITPIVLEHKFRLGPKLEDVIETKLGIIDENTVNIVVSKQHPKVLELMEAYLPNDKNIAVYGREHSLINQAVTEQNSSFKVDTGMQMVNIQLPTLAEFIGINLSSALKMANMLVGQLDIKKLEAVKDVGLSGRCEIISSTPLIILDGSICRESTSYIVSALYKMEQATGNKVAIVAVPSDKDYEGVMEILAKYFDRIILTKSVGAQYPFFQQTHPEAVNKFKNTIITNNLEEALELAEKFEATTIGIIGTQSLIGEARKKILVNTNNPLTKRG